MYTFTYNQFILGVVSSLIDFFAFYSLLATETRVEIEPKVD